MYSTFFPGTNLDGGATYVVDAVLVDASASVAFVSLVSLVMSSVVVVVVVVVPKPTPKAPKMSRSNSPSDTSFHSSE